MNKVFKLSLLLVALLFMAGCGSKKAPPVALSTSKSRKY